MAFIVDAADFDGTNDYLTRGADLTGIADGKAGALSFWVRIDGGDGGTMDIVGGTSFFRCLKNTSNQFSVLGFTSAGGGAILSIRTSGAYTAGATWLHVLASWDLATAAAHLYINDVSDLVSTTLTDDTINYTAGEFAVGAFNTGVLKFNGCIAEAWFNTAYIDFSVEANRRKFIDADGKPVDLGADGSTPTGGAPLVYLHLDDGEAVANFAVNAGTGEGFTITGTLDTADTSPSGEAPPPSRVMFRGS